MNKSISKDAIDILKKSTWAGNTRELQYLIERLFVTSPQNLISSRDLPPLAYENKDSSIDFTKGDISFDKEVGDFEKKLLEDAFNLHKSSHKVGKALGITQTRASRLLRKYQIK